ncbi:MAG: hydrogenase expression/formation protein HypE [Pirellulaceae bacterium]|nr:hydrogenase expression/formation protein HypE [Pirellulaceae bacterium]
MNDAQEPIGYQCPAMVTSTSDCVTLAHGEGGFMMRRLIRDRIRSKLPPLVSDLGDAVDVGEIEGSIAITTDSYVVSPLFFPGGDIGSMSVYGTVNDLAVAGAEPLWLTLSLIMEEGLPLAVLDRVIESVAKAAILCNVKIVAGDTKVVPRGAVDGMFINTSGVGRLPRNAPPGASHIQRGDLLIVSGPIGRHGISVLAARENLGFTPEPRSDSASVQHATFALQTALGGDLRSMRDATRGGISAVMHEWAEASGLTMKLDEASIPTTADVRGVCELLGLDPLYVANEGTFVAAIAACSVERAMDVLQLIPQTASAAVIGEVIESTISPVVIERLLGRLLAVDEPAGAPLPRIC